MEEFKFILILLSCAVVIITICKKLNLPPIIGYLLVGMIVGPGGLGWIPTFSKIHFFAELGVLFLMFSLGLKLSVPRILAYKNIIFGLGTFQVLISILFVYIAGIFFGLSHIQSFIIGSAFALSSTAVVIKQLSAQKELSTLHGSFSINILIFQDLAAVLLLIIIPAISSKTENYSFATFFFITAKGLGTVVIMFFFGIWILRPLFHFFAKTNVKELFMLVSLLVAMSAAGITYYLQLSMGLGAFLAGLLLGETEFRHQIKLDIRPFKQVFLGLFFIVIGAYLELNLLSSDWPYILITLISLILFKTIITMLLTMLFCEKNRGIAFRTGLILAHGGEFGFVVLTEAIKLDLISAEKQSAIFSGLVASILVAPLLIKYNIKISKKFFKTEKKEEIYIDKCLKLSDQVLDLKDHVILCGFGRVGQILSRFLDQENIPWIALDLDSVRISKASTAGEKSFYGDATNPMTLKEAGLSRARMIAVSFLDEPSALEILTHVRQMRMDIPVFVRTRDDTNLKEFQKAGATEIVPEQLEGGLMLASHLLLTLKIGPRKIMNMMRKVRTNRYEIMRGIYEGLEEQDVLEEYEDINKRSLYSILVPKKAKSIGCHLSEIFKNKDSEKEPLLKTLIRDEKRIYTPNLKTIIKENDVLVVLATLEESYSIEEQLINKK